MTDSNKKVGKKVGVIATCSVLFVAVIVLAIFGLLNHESSNDVAITNQTHYTGIVCENSSLEHPVLTDYTPVSFKNTISAVFSDDGLSTITYQYDGIYSSAEEAKDAEAFASADYNTILAKEYNVDINIFSHNFRRDNQSLSLTITARAEDVTQRTLPYFLLDNNISLPKNAETLAKAYKNKGFSCQETK